MACVTLCRRRRWPLPRRARGPRRGCSSSASTQRSKQVTAVQVIRGRPFEELASRLPANTKLWFGERPMFAGWRIYRIRGVLLLIATADVGGAVRRGVVRNYQLEILVALAQQGLDGLGEVVLAVVDRKPDAQPGDSVHACAALGSGLSAGQSDNGSGARRRHPHVAEPTSLDPSGLSGDDVGRARQLTHRHDPGRVVLDTSSGLPS